VSHRRSMAELACPQIVSSLSANLPLSGYGRFARRPPTMDAGHFPED
jgi:hypothetical protein